MIIVQPGAFRRAATNLGQEGSLDLRHTEWNPTHTRSLGFKKARDADAGLCDASVIVSAGRGIGRRENHELVRKVAALFSRSATAGSRPLCDLGWLPYSAQVGQTGATVAPELYFACGISGAQQHVAGIKGAKFVVVVNTDPNAAFFNECDVGIIEDLEQFLSGFLEELDN